MDQPTVVDTNILFSALLSRGSSFGKTILESERQFFIGELVLAELFKHKERIVQHSRLSEEEVVKLFYDLMLEIEFYKEELVSTASRREAYKLCRDVDETDTPHVALTLEIDGLLWTGDKELKEGLKAKGFDRFFEPGK